MKKKKIVEMLKLQQSNCICMEMFFMFLIICIYRFFLYTSNPICRLSLGVALESILMSAFLERCC